MPKIAVSVLNVPIEDAVSIFYNLETAKIDYFHIDVMDGKFVEANTLDKMKEFSLTLSHITNIGLDVHLMVEENLEEIVDSYMDLEPEIITFHYEAVQKDKEKILNIIDELHKNDVKVGLAINPETDVNEILDYCKYLHQVVVMSVNPGKGGQSFIPETLEKIKVLREFLDKSDLPVDIEVDGGINDKNCETVRNAGADILVSGNYIIKSEDYNQSVKKLRGIE